MKATILIVELLANADLGFTGHLLLRLGTVLVLLGLLLSVPILWAVRNAPEGYEDEEGFHAKPSQPTISSSSGVHLLSPHNAG